MRKRCSQHQCTINIEVKCFRTVTIRTYFRDSMSSGNTTVSTGRKLVPEPTDFGTACAHGSGRVQQMGQDTEDVRGRLGVGHLGERLGHTTQSCGQLAPPRQVQGGQLIDQRRRSLVGNSHGSSTNQHDPDEKLGHAAMPKARDRRTKMVAALTRLQQTSDTTSSISRPRSVLLGPGRFGRMRTSPSRRWSSSRPCGRAIRRSGRRGLRVGGRSRCRLLFSVQLIVSLFPVMTAVGIACQRLLAPAAYAAADQRSRRQDDRRLVPPIDTGPARLLTGPAALHDELSVSSERSSRQDSNTPSSGWLATCTR
jgi:hypothetical protein